MVNHFIDEALRKIIIDLGFLLHEHFHITLVYLFSLDFQQLSKISLCSTTYRLNFTLGKWIQNGFSLSVNIVDQEVCMGLLDVINLALKQLTIRYIIQTSG